MFTIIRDLARQNTEFLCGLLLFAVIVAAVILSYFSPYGATDIYLLPPDMPPGSEYWLGTTSRGQDVFWQLTIALRNTLFFGIGVAFLSRIISLVVGLVAGYAGGAVDRVLMAINDSVMVIPQFPLLILFYFVLKDNMTWAVLIVIMASLGWSYDARLIRSVALGLKSRPFTTQSVYSGMTMRKILVEEHLPYVLPILCHDDEQHDLVDRHGDHAFGARFHRHRDADHGHDDLLGQCAFGADLGHLVVGGRPRRRHRHSLPGALPALHVDERI
jgi:peptide/nickel transport system permease protein